MSSAITLGGLLPGSSMVVERVGLPENVKRRLNELGIAPGAKIDMLYTGFGGSPVAVRVCGAVVALRLSDARLIHGNALSGGESRP